MKYIIFLAAACFAGSPPTQAFAAPEDAPLKPLSGSALVARVSQPRVAVERTGEFEGPYLIGSLICRVKPARMSFEVKCPAAIGNMRVFFDGPDDAGRPVFISEQTLHGKGRFVFETSRFDSGTFTQENGEIFQVKRAAP